MKNHMNAMAALSTLLFCCWSASAEDPAPTDAQAKPAPLITRNDSVTVTADVTTLDLLSPDPAEKVFVRQDLLDANPGVLAPRFPFPGIR